MEPKKLVVPPHISASEILALRAHIDEAITDPDYSVVISYECNWEDEGGKVLEDLPDSRVNACGPEFKIENDRFVPVDEDPKE